MIKHVQLWWPGCEASGHPEFEGHEWVGIVFANRDSPIVWTALLFKATKAPGGQWSILNAGDKDVATIFGPLIDESTCSGKPVTD